MKPQAVKYMIEAIDMNRAVKFYRDVLGFEESFTSMHWSELSHNGAIIGIHGGGDEVDRSTGISLQYEDVRSAYSEAITGGARSLQEPHQREGEPIILSSIRDPEGNLITLTQYVG